MTHIPPTVGRVIHYYPTADDNGALPPQGQPLAGIVACVWNDRCINITYFDANGNAWGKTSVPLVQDDDDTRPGAGYCAWMPYQKGQAAKTESLESQLAGKPAIGVDLAAEQDQCVRVFLEKGAVVKIEGIPVELEHSAVVLTRPANVPLIFPPRTASPVESGE
ncbi:hypothetical protein [Ectopseudomonas khazarica]|uniref:hypothetical protein n=1 Tax=Ectopseudomonas khazarica TaxID=2502979 RepID=UPI003B92624F